ncbi:hypothetical protein EUX98_g3766 [Antrodiella citrinella]|uniref:DNA topoisomerase n=1 Tax=Antrodiella citrinella TaxID=2447956 RepID=A0A4S4MVQ7_9APHY|nr:hypothetical protein EUX98_g3766 [Antrodiella citrinella]
MHVLCVAEKPSISKSITQILSGGQFTTRPSPANFIKNYDFNYPQTNSTFTVTAVAGHMLVHDFGPAYSKWTSCDPFTLFDAPILVETAKDKLPIKRNLVSEARKAQMLMIWTDCDREGEHIGAEVVKICREGRRNITVKRARFSAIIAQQIHHAAQHPVELDMNQSNAVEARIQLDLRIGASLTRLQSLKLQQRFPQQLTSVISYGPCQFPTLGFVVARYNRVKAFRPEPFWYIYLAMAARGSDDEEIPFTWRRGHLFDHDIAATIYREVMNADRALITRVTQKETKKWKPYPLTTVELQKAGSRILKISPKRILDIAESLYQQGFLSYPRTETDQYDPAFDFGSLIEKQKNDGAWGAFADSLQNGGFQAPRRGKKNDKAHPPIHPTAYAGNLANDDKRVYEYITRRFLASCSKDALGSETTIEVTFGREEFYTTGLIVLERNYLEVFPYDKWASKELPDVQQGQTFVPSACELRQGQTSRPTLLTEADLVSEMDKNGIGTDATIAQHIQTIIDRKYVMEHKPGATKYLVPSTLGIALVDGYNAIEYDKSLSKPDLRRDTERDMVKICDGVKTQGQVLAENIERYKEVYAKAKRDFMRIINSVNDRLQGNQISYDLDFGDDDGDEGGNGGDGGGAGGGGAGGGGGGRGSRGGRGGRGSRSAPTSRRGRGGNTGGAAARRRDDDDDRPAPPAPAPARRRPPNSTNTHNRNLSAGVNCNCGVPASDRQTGDGRRHWSCGKSDTCQFFQFIDGPSRQGTAQGRPGPSVRGVGGGVAKQCDCNKPAILLVTKQGENAGRKFWKCSGPTDAKCKYWEWAIDAEIEGVPVLNEGVGGGASARTGSFGNDGGSGASGSRPSGVGGTTGECYKCGQEGHWASSCRDTGSGGGSGAAPRSRSFGTGAGASSGSSGVCYKCGEEGHYANADIHHALDCPQAGGGGASGSGGGRGGGGGGGSSMACYKCGEDGHYAKDCPGVGGDGSGSGGLRPPRATSDIVCYKCKQSGHYSNACTNTSSGAKRSSSSASNPRVAKRGRGRGRGRSTSSTRGRGRKKAGSRTPAAQDEEEDYFSDGDIEFAAF